MTPDQPQAKPRSRKMYLLWGVALTLLAVIGLGCAFWRPIGLSLLRYQTEQRFRSNFATNNSLFAAISPGDWAVDFGGTASLGLLDELASDDRVAPIGQAQARAIRATINSGGHLGYLKSMIEDRKGLPSDCAAPGGLKGALLEYIYERDSEYLKGKQIAQ